ncbi:hypothetical protein CONPUDRAFT_166468 [Coniophora puteana RWD-64-598 SS2]|uniref:Uncharacterized protein n=1 Tax=Coniophora puteana (strain RWD-64-598) TaxID=741705 RepID=A0A5M3MM47_CONPW|nr:uncharacterized protein CONPUDRAFT_166468 [Coniophora puteana RWD-64-598 SS2]EIW79755.1 hypothetical protein CONPUDRAFT_166468 [Coniophora puteana RWD-64-598 SS2]
MSPTFVPILTLCSGPPAFSSATSFKEDISVYRAVPCYDGPLPPERTIDMQAICDLDPDHKRLFTSSNNIEEIRLALKLRTARRQYDSWLYKSKRCNHAQLESAEVPREIWLYHGEPLKVINEASSSVVTPAETSSVITTSTSTPRPLEFGVSNPQRLKRHRRSPSTVASRFPGIEQLLFPTSKNPRDLSHCNTSDAQSPVFTSQSSTHSLPLEAPFNPSTSETTTSRRPIGPTHILVLFVAGSHDSRPALLQPINDTLFALHVPNLTDLSVLPKYRPDTLPFVFMRVCKLDGWHDLLVWIHTRNQAKLMRSVLPEWIRDLLHPLPRDAVVDDGCTKRRKRKRAILDAATGSLPKLNIPQSVLKLSGTCSRRILRKKLIHVNPSGSVRTVDTIAREISELDEMHEGSTSSLINTMKRLNTLKDNLEEIGYYGRELWVEVGTAWGILLKALTYQAEMKSNGLFEQ